MMAMAMDKAPFVRPGVPRGTVDRSPFIPRPDESGPPRSSVQYHPLPTSTAELSELQRVVHAPVSHYVDNNNSQLDINPIDGRTLDMKPTIQHLNAFDSGMARMSSNNPLVQNPALITSATTVNTGFPYSSCDI